MKNNIKQRLKTTKDDYQEKVEYLEDLLKKAYKENNDLKKRYETGSITTNKTTTSSRNKDSPTELSIKTKQSNDTNSNSDTTVVNENDKLDEDVTELQNTRNR
jgi:hypothetical protein